MVERLTYLMTTSSRKFALTLAGAIGSSPVKAVAQLRLEVAQKQVKVLASRSSASPLLLATSLWSAGTERSFAPSIR